MLEHDDLRRTLRRIAHEIAEGNPDSERLAVVGIHTRLAHFFVWPLLIAELCLCAILFSLWLLLMLLLTVSVQRGGILVELDA